MKKILITGASRGIGKALAYEFAKNDCVLTLLARNEEQLKEISNSLNSKGIKTFYISCDAGNYEQMKTAIEFAYDKMGGIDLAVLNAGVSGSGKISEFSSENLKRIFETNLYGIAYALEFLIPKMKDQGQGIIAAVTSLIDARGIPGKSFYCSSKTAATFLLEAARVELKPLGITVITVKPGFVKTGMTATNQYPMPFIMEAEKAAKIIVDGIYSGKKRIFFPLPLVLLAYFAKIVPSAFFEFIMKFWVKYEKS